LPHKAKVIKTRKIPISNTIFPRVPSSLYIIKADKIKTMTLNIKKIPVIPVGIITDRAMAEIKISNALIL